MKRKSAAEPNRSASRLVVIGASAGGLEAMRPIVAGLIEDQRTAYVLAQHMAPDQGSKLPELLARLGPVVVCSAVDGDVLLPDRLYVCPPDAEISILLDRLAVSPRDLTQHISPSIDRLFKAAAESPFPEIIAILLSGSGRDGVAGANAVRQAGGTVVAQKPEAAAQPGLPQAAIDAGVVDLVGGAEQIARWLAGGDLDALSVAPGATQHSDDSDLIEILRIVGQEAHVDLSRYKATTLLRQTRRRCQVLGLATLSAYAALLRTDAAEVRSLFKSFLISVSGFFRDPGEFAALAKALRPIVQGRGEGESLRVWVPACATGEEA